MGVATSEVIFLATMVPLLVISIKQNPLLTQTGGWCKTDLLAALDRMQHH